MSSTLVPCGVCGLSVRFPGGQSAPASTICDNPACQAEAARQERVNTPADPVVEDKPTKDKAKK